MNQSLNLLSSVVVSFLWLALPVFAGQGADESGPGSHEHGRPRSNAEDRWKQLDQDNDGRISRSEWKRDPQAFDRLDANKDGFLAREELRSAAREFRGRHHNGLKQMDTDGDGKISRGEWKGKDETFNRLDANHDSLLTPDELRQGREHRERGAHRPDHADKNTL